MTSLSKAKKYLYNNQFFKALLPYRDILSTAEDSNFWTNPKNKEFVDLIDNKIKEVEKKYKKIRTRKAILESNLTSLYLLAGRVKMINKHVKELDNDFIKPFKTLISNL